MRGRVKKRLEKKKEHRLTVGIFSFEAAATFTTNNFNLTPTQFNFSTIGYGRGSPKTFNAGSSTISIGVSGNFFDPGNGQRRHKDC
jgi:hypothetical protein